jgi:hypothetical protein
MNTARHLIIGVVITTLSACGGGSSESGTPAFDPVVSMNANIGSEPIGNYTAEYTAIYNAGARGAQTAAPWYSPSGGSLEPTPNNYVLTMVSTPYLD